MNLFILVEYITNDFLGFSGNFIKRFIGGWMMFQEKGPNDSEIEDNRSIVFNRQHAPDKEHALQQEVEWNYSCQVSNEEFEYGENGIQHPVGEPLGVIGFCARFNCLNWNVGGIHHADEIAQ